MMLGIESWTLARPELFLAAVTALLLVYGVVRGEVATAFVSIATVLALLVTAVLLFAPYREGTAFASLFIVDRLTTTMKALVLVGSAIAMPKPIAVVMLITMAALDSPRRIAFAMRSNFSMRALGTVAKKAGASRVVFIDCSPTWSTQPPMTSSILVGSMPVRATSSRRLWASRSTGWM